MYAFQRTDSIPIQLRSVLNYSGADKKLGPEWILECVHDAVASLCNPCMRRTVDHCTSAGQVMKRAGVDKKLGPEWIFERVHDAVVSAQSPGQHERRVFPEIGLASESVTSFYRRFTNGT